MNVFEHVFVQADGRPLPLERYRNQPILLVTFQPDSERLPQLWKLQRLYGDLRSAGLLVMGLPVPSRDAEDDSIEQEFSEDDLQDQIIDKYGIRYPVSKPIRVRGPGVHRLFRELRDKHGREVLPREGPHKYLFNRKGALVKHWPTRVEPDHPRFRHDVVANLEAWVV